MNQEREKKQYATEEITVSKAKDLLQAFIDQYTERYTEPSEKRAAELGVYQGLVSSFIITKPAEALQALGIIEKRYHIVEFDTEEEIKGKEVFECLLLGLAEIKKQGFEEKNPDKVYKISTKYYEK